MRAVTADKYLVVVRGLLGWMVRHASADAAVLRLRDVFPTNERGSVQLSFEYIQWLTTERKINARTETVTVRSLIQLAKYIFQKESTTDPAEGDKPFHDIVVVRELRKMHNDAKVRAKNAPAAAQEDLKWITWPEYLKAVEHLRLECSERSSSGSLRPDKAIAHS